MILPQVPYTPARQRVLSVVRMFLLSNRGGGNRHLANTPQDEQWHLFVEQCFVPRMNYLGTLGSIAGRTHGKRDPFVVERHERFADSNRQ